MSKEQNIPSFAHDNGLCGVRNYFTYKNITSDVRSATEDDKHVLDVPDKRILRTTASEDSLLTDESNGFLRMKASPCDRNYEHTDYGICVPCPVDQICTGSTDCVCTDSNYEPVHALNTWERKASGDVHLRFCNVNSADGDLINLVSPYMHIDSLELAPVDTLNESRWDIQRCLDFDICPTSSFTVRGRVVAQRVVLLLGVEHVGELEAGADAALEVVEGALEAAGLVAALAAAPAIDLHLKALVHTVVSAFASSSGSLDQARAFALAGAPSA
jgi:hypothetical protein